VEMLELNFVRLPFDTSVLLLSEQQNIETPGMELVRLRVNTSDSLYPNGQQNAETLEIGNGLYIFDLPTLKQTAKALTLLLYTVTYWGGGSRDPSIPLRIHR